MRFSHIYIETGARRTEIAQRVLDRFPAAEIITIPSYRRFFGRPRQLFQVQKRLPQLVLAVKPGDFLYAGSEHCQDFGYDNFFYTTPMLNCMHHCDYCYLQGLLPSANLVLFVNTNDFLQAADQRLATRPNPAQPLYLCISYDTDLLALEHLTGYCRQWIQFARPRPDLLIEIRTKSAAYETIADMPPANNVILAWTLSPSTVIDRYEHRTPSLIARLQAIARALDDGWPVRLCLDPVIAVPGWRKLYSEFIEQLFRSIPPERLRDVALGTFRMAREQFKHIRRDRPDCDLYHGDMVVEGMITVYPRHRRRAILSRLRQHLEEYLPPERIVSHGL